MPRFNPQRLKVALARRGVGKHVFCNDIGISTRALLAFEKGEKRPSMETAHRLADALGFPVRFFFMDDPPEVSADAASFRALSSLTVKQRDQALSAGVLAADLAGWLDERFDLPQPDVPRLLDIDPDRAALFLRSEWGLGERAAPNMIHLAEAHGVRVFSISEESVRINAFSLWRGEEPFVFLNTKKGAESSRYDIAHELGHLILHGQHEAPRGREYEHQANRFAAAFLMPARAVVASGLSGASLPTIIKAKRQWGVSVLALIVRLHNLGLVTDWHYRTLCIEAGKLGVRKDEPNSIPGETSQLLTKVFAILSDEGQRRGAVAKQLGFSRHELNRLVFGLVPVPIAGGDEPTTTHRGEPPALRVV